MIIATILCAANLVANGDMEALVGNAVAGWNFNTAAFSVENDAGRGKSRGLVWRVSDPTKNFIAKGRFPVRPGTAYKFGGWINVRKLAGDSPFGALYFDCYSKDGKWLCGASSPFVTKIGEWVCVKGVSENLPEGASYGEILAYAKKGSTGEIVFDDVFVEAKDEAFIGEIWTSAYRNAAASGRVKIFAEFNRFAPEAAFPGLRLAFRIPRGKSQWVELKTVRHEDYAVAEAEVTEFRFGRAPVQFRVETNGVYLLSKTIFFERFRGRDPRRVHFDEQNRVIVDGRKFFPIGMYAGGVTKSDVDIMAKGGFNCVMPYRSFTLTSEIMDHCLSRGVMVMPNIKDSFHGERYCCSEVVDESTGESWVGECVSRLKDHPALLAWYSCDESEISMVPRLRERQKLLERLDPDHPTWMVLYQAPKIRKYLGGFDVIGTDPYPIADLGQYPKRTDGIWRVTDWTHQTYAGVFDGARPVWQVPQCFDWAIILKTEAERMAAKSRPPTEEEVRNMTWQCMVGGANGIVFYAYHELKVMDKRTPFERAFATVSKVARELRARESFFLDGESEPVDTGNERVVARRWKLAGRSLLAVVNASERSQSAKIGGRVLELKPIEVRISE